VIVQILPYSTLLADLEISSIRELEDLIIDAIYQDIVRGKLDQKEQQFEVEFTMGRDLQVSQLPALLDELKNWYARLRIPTYFRYRQPAGHVAQLV
jgi:COP9 signalosome complex subunit 7